MPQANLNSYQKAFFLCLAVIVIAWALLRIPSDDGLRHVGLAFGDLKSWGDVYPFSRFEDFKDYNPWYGYDRSLHRTATLFKILPVPELISKFILVKILSLIFPGLLFYLALKRSGLIASIKDKETFALVLMVMLFFLAYAFQRSAFARPFIFGTLFLLYSIGRRGFINGLVSAGILTFFYPHLSWFYILPVSLAHLVRGDRRYSLGAISFLMAFLIFQSDSFWGFQIALFQSDIARSAIDAKIGEFNLTVTTSFFIIVLVLFTILYPWFSRGVRKLNYVNLLILIYMVPSLKYIRYFIDIISPLLLIGFGQDIFNRVHAPLSKLVFSWKDIIRDNARMAITFFKSGMVKVSRYIQRKGKEVRQIKNKAASPVKERNIKPLLIGFYLILIVAIFQINHGYYREFKEFSDVLEPIPGGSIILLPFNQQYKTLFSRPDLHLIPSCEIGFPANEIIKEYREFLNDGMLLPLAKKTGARYFLESGDIYVSPEQGRSLELIKEKGKLKLWMIKD